MKRPALKAAGILAFGVLACAFQAPVQAQQPEGPRTGATDAAGGLPAVIAYPLEGETIDMDGRVEEEAWAAAVPITDFRQQEPVEGAPASEGTEVRIAFDADDLYIAVIAYDDPTGILARQKERDASLFSDDSFQLILDTFLDGRTGYSFEINPAGAMVDGLLSGRSGFGGGGGGGGFRGGPPGGGGGGGGGFGGGNAWDGIWEARTQQRPDGWSAEIRIPFRTLNFNPALDEWGINFQRSIRRKNEDVLWRGWRRNEGMSPVYAGRLQGLRGLSQGLGLEAVPSTIASVRHVPCGDSGCPPGVDPTTFPRELSLDLNYSVTSSLRASASINTDFAEVEADRRQVNLTRFPLFFPERRDFFLEGSGVFSFAPGHGADPFYSRNIGLDAASGQQIPIRYGTRLTGQAGAYELGFYQIGAGEHTYLDTSAGLDQTIAGEDFTVARVKRRFFEQSSIGVVYTRRSNATDASGTGSYAGQTAGLDLELRTRRFMGDRNLSLTAFAVVNSDPQRGGDFFRSLSRLSARGVRLAYPNDIWFGQVSYSEFGGDYDPSLGFVRRNNFRRVEPSISWSPRAEGISWLRNFNFGAQWRKQWQMAGELAGNVEEEELRLNLFGINLESGDGIDFSATRTHEYLGFAFPVSSGVTVQPGDYEWWQYQVFVRTAGYRRAGLFGGFTKGGFWDGDNTSIFAGLNLRPMPGINSRINLQRNDVTMPTASFTANVYSIDTQWTPTPWVGFTNQLQYDDVSEVVGLFLRMRWIVRPGNDIYLVYTHNWQNFGAGILQDPWLRTLSNGGSVKLNYTYRF